MTLFRFNFSRPKFGQIMDSTIPMKNITIGTAESLVADAMAADGASTRALQYERSIVVPTKTLAISGRRTLYLLDFKTVRKRRRQRGTALIMRTLAAPLPMMNMESAGMRSMDLLATLVKVRFPTTASKT